MAKLEVMLSIEDLEKIFTDNDKGGIKLTDFVVQEFSRRYLKDIANSKPVGKVVDNLY